MESPLNGEYVKLGVCTAMAAAARASQTSVTLSKPHQKLDVKNDRRDTWLGSVCFDPGLLLLKLKVPHGRTYDKVYRYIAV